MFRTDHIDTDAQPRRVFWVGPVPLPPGVAAMTIGRVVFVAVGVHLDQRLYRHEREHLLQFARLGVGRFLYRYLREYLALRRRGIGHGEAYNSISFEQEARRAEGVA